MKVHNQKAYQYKTSSPHSTSNRKWEKATGAESLSRASRYQALSSFISSRFSLSFHPHSLCSYLEQKQRGEMVEGSLNISFHRGNNWHYEGDISSSKRNHVQ